MSSSLPSTNVGPPAWLSDKDYADFLFRAYVEAMAHARHQETTRSAVAGSIVALTTASVGALAFLGRSAADPSKADGAAWPALIMSVFVFVLGACGSLYCARAAYRYRRLREGAKAVFQSWSEVVGAHGRRSPAEIFDSGKPNADRWLERSLVGTMFGRVKDLRQGVLIVLLMVAVAVVGLSMAVASARSLKFPV